MLPSVTVLIFVLNPSFFGRLSCRIHTLSRKKLDVFKAPPSRGHPINTVQIRFLITQLFKMSLVPLLEVTWPMFFLGDQLCSHARLINDFLVFSCVSVTNPQYRNVSQYFEPPPGQ
jgi:hypothetical protein